MTDIPPATYPDQAAPDPALPAEPVRDDEALLTRFDAWDKDATSHWMKWREKARESYAFVSNDQWSKDERAAAEEAGRLATTMNRIGAMVAAVAGAEISGRQEVQYLPRSLEDGGVNEVLTKGAEWIRDQVGADREESDAFRDVLVCGLGFTETVMSYDDEPQGQIVIARIDPLEVTPDASARKPNLTDARYLRRRRKIAKADFEDMYPGATPEGDSLLSSTGKSGGNRRTAYREDKGGDEEVCRDDEVALCEWQWFDFETVFLAEHPQTGAIHALNKDQRDSIEADYTAVGATLRTVRQRRKRYWRTVVCGRQILEHEPLPDGEFNIKCITGERNRNEGTWSGIVDSMKDPQRLANILFSLLHHTIRTNAKGGILAETDAFEDPKQAESSWAKPDAITWLAEGGLSKVEPKPAPQIPAAISQLLQFAVSSIRETSGVNEELLGLVGRDQAGVLEQQRKEAAYGIMASFYDSLRSYRQIQGKFLLKVMRYLPPDYLVRIVGDDGVAKYVPLARQPDTAKFDVVVDEAPTGPNQKERTWALIVQMMPWLKDLDPTVWAELVRYSPFPDAVVQKLAAALTQAANKPPDPAVAAATNAKIGRDQAGAQKDAAVARRTDAETTALMAHIGGPQLMPAPQPQGLQ